MRPFHIDKYKTTIWWSAKCGCSTIKNMIHKYILQDNETNWHANSWNLDWTKIDYKNILIVRNPEMRMISTYLDKYVWWKQMFFHGKDYSLYDFLSFLCNHLNDWKHVEEHHFARQFEEEFSQVELMYFAKKGKRFQFDVVLKLEELDLSQFLKMHFPDIPLIPSNVECIHVAKKSQSEWLKDAHHLTKPDILSVTNHILPCYHSFLKEEVKQMIQTIYAKDYFYLHFYHLYY